MMWLPSSIFNRYLTELAPDRAEWVQVVSGEFTLVARFCWKAARLQLRMKVFLT